MKLLTMLAQYRMVDVVKQISLPLNFPYRVVHLHNMILILIAQQNPIHNTLPVKLSSASPSATELAAAATYASESSDNRKVVHQTTPN